MNIRILAIFVILTISFAVGVISCSLPKITLFSDEQNPLKEYTLEGKGDQKVLVMSIDGVISGRGRQTLLRSYPSIIQQTAAYLKRAENDNNIKALLIKVNTPGGSVTASDILYHEISTYKERTRVKIVVVMMNLATSGGYYVSLPADVIMAHPTTTTGSIGVIYTRPNFSALMEKVGVSVNVNTSGPNKDMGSPFRPASEEDDRMFQELTDKLARRFIDLVVRHRGLNAEQLKEIATARVLLAEEAMNLGLVDSIGYLDDAISKAKKISGLDENARVVAYRRYEPNDDTIYNPAIQTLDNNPGSMTSVFDQWAAVSEADFYYIWPAAIGH